MAGKVLLTKRSSAIRQHDLCMIGDAIRKNNAARVRSERYNEHPTDVRQDATTDLYDDKNHLKSNGHFFLTQLSFLILNYFHYSFQFKQKNM